MLNPTQILITPFGDHLEQAFNKIYGSDPRHYAQQAAIGGRLALEFIGNSDAHYHDMQHTLHVTSVGLEIMHGKHMHVQTTPEDWLHYIVALLCHDIGYLRGVCPGDTRDAFVIDDQGNTVTLSRGATDASLTPYHVERGKILVRERLADVPFIDTDRIIRP